MIGPSCRVPVVYDTTWLLIFEACVEYLNLMKTIIDDVKRHAFFNYFEVLRVRYLGGLLLDALTFNLQQILTEPMPQPSSRTSGQVPVLPFMKSRIRTNNGKRASGCIRQILAILDFGGRRWNKMHLKERFERDSAMVLAKLEDTPLYGDYTLPPIAFPASMPYPGPLAPGRIHGTIPPASLPSTMPPVSVPGSFSVHIPDTMPINSQPYGRRSQGDMIMSNSYVPQVPNENPSNPRSRPGLSGYSSI